MAVMLERWNDDKMDALDAKVDRLEVGFARTDAKLDGLDTRIGRLETETKAGFEKVNDRLLYALLAIIAAGATIAAAVIAAPHL